MLRPLLRPSRRAADPHPPPVAGAAGRADGRAAARGVRAAARRRATPITTRRPRDAHVRAVGGHVAGRRRGARGRPAPPRPSSWSCTATWTQRVPRCRPRGRRPYQPSERRPGRARAGPRCVFCGINPGRVSAAAAAHFANPRNDFWRLLHDAGLHAAPARARRAGRPARPRLRHHERRLPDDARLGRPPPRRLRRRAERLERHRARAPARGAIAFVGKEAYRGLFGERAGARAAEAARSTAPRLYVLPSTSPANAAVPYAERAALVPWPSRVVDADAEDVRPRGRPRRRRPGSCSCGSRTRRRQSWWATPGGGAEPDEDDGATLRRELLWRRSASDDPLIRPLLWHRESVFSWGGADISGRRSASTSSASSATRWRPTIDLAPEGLATGTGGGRSPSSRRAATPSRRERSRSTSARSSERGRRRSRWTSPTSLGRERVASPRWRLCCVAVHLLAAAVWVGGSVARRLRRGAGDPDARGRAPRARDARKLGLRSGARLGYGGAARCRPDGRRAGCPRLGRRPVAVPRGSGASRSRSLWRSSRCRTSTTTCSARASRPRSARVASSGRDRRSSSSAGRA